MDVVDAVVGGGEECLPQRVSGTGAGRLLDLAGAHAGHRDPWFQDAEKRRTRVASRSLVHMDQPHLAAVEMTFTPLNWSGQIEILSALDGRVRNRGVARYRDLSDDHLMPLDTAAADGDTVTLKVQTRQSLIQIPQAARSLAGPSSTDISTTL